MNAARRADGALRPPQLAALLEAAHPVAVSPERLVRIGRAQRLGNLSRVVNSVTLLVELGVLVEIGEEVAAAPPPKGGPDWEGMIRRAVLERFCWMLEEAGFVSAIQPGDHPAGLRLDALQLPGRDLGYPPLLLQLGIASREDMFDRSWVVAEDCVPRFLALIMGLNQADGHKRLTLDELLALQSNQADAGRRAEAFALAHELRRLAGHRFLNQVRLISDDNVGAGFDLLSFDKLGSLRHDRMIEVKGYGSTKAFHWSEGELAKARELRDLYWLYLVDLSLLQVQGYEPEMIQDPWAYFIEQNPEGWSSEPQSYKFTAPERGGPGTRGAAAPRTGG